MNISSTSATFRRQTSTVLAHTHLDTSIYWISRAGGYCYSRPTPLSACMCVSLYTGMRMQMASNTKTTYTHTRAQMDWFESRQTVYTEILSGMHEIMKLCTRVLDFVQVQNRVQHEGRTLKSPCTELLCGWLSSQMMSSIMFVPTL